MFWFSDFSGQPMPAQGYNNPHQPMPVQGYNNPQLVAGGDCAIRPILVDIAF